MDAYSAESWHELYIMVGGAAAALAGLIFVAVSLNHELVLSLVKLPGLAVRTLSLLVAIVVFCAFGLTPQPSRALGVELLCAGMILVVVMLGTTIRTFEPADLARWRFGNVATAIAASIAAPAAGLSVIVEAGGGLYWLLAAMIVGIVIAAYYAWVLLVEVRR